MDTILQRVTPTVLLEVLADELAARGLRFAPLLEGAGVRMSDFAGADRYAPAAVIGKLLADSVALADQPGLALRVGSRCGLGWAGTLGVAARHAATLGEALADLELLPELRDTVGGVSLVRVGDEAHFSYSLDAADLPSAPLLYEIALGMMCSVVRELTGGAVAPWVVRLPCRRPSNLAPYHAYLGPHLKFDAVVAELVFHADVLAFPLRTANPTLRRLALAQVARQISRREPLICVAVRNAIHHAMARGACSRADVAAFLDLHERAMGRRLQNAGTSFQALLDDEREVRARLLLRHTRVPVERIGRSLGYRDSTVFGRAFRRWTGVLPGVFRAQSRLDQPPSAIARATSATPPPRNTSPTITGFAMV